MMFWSCQEGLSSTELEELSLSIIRERQFLGAGAAKWRDDLEIVFYQCLT